MVRINLSLATILTAALMAAAAFSSSLSAATKATVVVDYGKLPLVFEANQGQTDERVKFLSRGRGYSLFLTESEAVLSLGGKRSLRVRLEGAAPAPRMTGLERLPGVSNYFIGRDPKNWRTKIPHYAKVGYEGVYPGIDMVFYGTKQRQLEYDFIVAPGADPGAIKLAFEGAERLEIDELGDLVVHLAGGEVRFLKPVVYQEDNGERRSVAGGYILKDGRVGFEVANYDPSKPLVIDPILAYSTYLGGSADDYARDVSVDVDGYAYVTGTTRSADFAPLLVEGPTDTYGDAFVAKVTPDGAHFIYVTFLGGASYDTAGRIALDVDGHAYVVGQTGSADFPTTYGALLPDYDGASAFVVKLSPDGDLVEYASFLELDSVNGVALRPGCPDPTEIRCKIYLVSSTNDAALTTTPGAFQTTLADRYDTVLAVIDPGGAGAYDLLYATFIGGTQDDFGHRIAVDSNGDAYVTGKTSSEDFPTSPSAFDPGCGDNTDPEDCYTSIITPTGGTISAPFNDAFVVKISPQGNGTGDLVYATYLGGTGRDADRRVAIAVDAAGYAYIAGDTKSSDFPTTVGAFMFVHGGGDAFVAKLNQDGSDLIYSTYLGGRDGGEVANGIAVRPGCPEEAGTGCRAYVTGSTGSSDFPTTGGAVQTTLGWGGDAFVSIVNATGSDLLYSTYLGGSTCKEGPDGSCSGRGETGFDIAVDPLGHAYVVGVTFSDDFPVTEGALDTDCGDDSMEADCTDTLQVDGFLAKFEDMSPHSGACEIHVANIDLVEVLSGNKSSWQAYLAVTLHFCDETPAGEVVMTGEWRGNSGYQYVAACATNNNGGNCEVSSGDIPAKNDFASFAISAAALSEFLYDASANHDPDPDSNGTSITVFKPAKGSGGGGGGKPCNPKKEVCT